jgi:hypothetical protein
MLPGGLRGSWEVMPEGLSTGMYAWKLEDSIKGHRLVLSSGKEPEQ